MEYIKSKIKGVSIFVAIVPLLLSWVFVVLIIRTIETFSGVLSDYLSLLLFVVLLFFMLNLLKAVRYIIIKSDKLTYYSLFRPFGKTLYFKDYIGKIVVQDVNATGRFNVIYLIDKNNRTDLRIPGIHYKKFGTIIRAIPLKSIDFKPTIKEDLKLSLTGRITIKEGRNDKKAEKKREKFMTAIQIVAVVGLLLMVLGYLLRWILG